MDEIKKSGVIRIGVFTDKAPFGYVDANGVNQGYDVVYAQRIAQDLGVKVEFTSLDPAARAEYVNTGKVDITLANFTVTKERAEQVDFAKPYMKVALGVVSPEKAVIHSVDELKGKTLIIAKGTTAETYFEKNYPEVKRSRPTTPRSSRGPRRTRALRSALTASVITTRLRRRSRRAMRRSSTS